METNAKRKLTRLPPKLHVNPYMSSAEPSANFGIRAMGRTWAISMSALVCQVTIILIAIEFANANITMHLLRRDVYSAGTYKLESQLSAVKLPMRSNCPLAGVQMKVWVGKVVAQVCQGGV